MSFWEYDAIIAPIMATDAIEHDHGAFGDRTVMVDNDERPYFEQIFGRFGYSKLRLNVISTENALKKDCQLEFKYGLMVILRL